MGESMRGFPRVIHDGYYFGLPRASHITKEIITWQCTGSEFGTRKRCSATVQTRTIDGYAMMRIRNTNHICVKPSGKPTKK